MSQKNERETARQNRKSRIRKRIFGTEQRPRLSVFRSAKHIYAQLVVDSTGATILAASTLSPEIRTEIGELDKSDAAKKVGLSAGIPVAVGAFDAHLGAVGSGIKTGVLVKIIGTSTCDMMVVPVGQKLADVPGLCGIVNGSILPGFYGLEAGQSAVGDIFKWYVDYLCPAAFARGDAYANLGRAAAEKRDGDGNHRVNTRGEVKCDPACEDPQKGPDHGPSVQRTGRLDRIRCPGEACGSTFDRKAQLVPFRQPQGVAIDAFIPKLNGHPGRRVAADSGQARSVKNDLPVFVRAKEFFQRVRLAPARPPGRFHREIDRSAYVPGAVLPLLAGVHQQKIRRCLAMAVGELLGGNEGVTTGLGLGDHLVPGGLLGCDRALLVPC